MSTQQTLNSKLPINIPALISYSASLISSASFCAAARGSSGCRAARYWGGPGESARCPLPSAHECVGCRTPSRAFEAVPRVGPPPRVLLDTVRAGWPESSYRSSCNDSGARLRACVCAKVYPSLNEEPHHEKTLETNRRDRVIEAR